MFHPRECQLTDIFFQKFNDNFFLQIYNFPSLQSLSLKFNSNLLTSQSVKTLLEHPEEKIKKFGEFRALRKLALHFRKNPRLNESSVLDIFGESPNDQQLALTDLDLDFRETKRSLQDESQHFFRSILMSYRIVLQLRGAEAEGEQNAQATTVREWQDMIRKLVQFRNICLEMKVTALPTPDDLVPSSFSLKESIYFDFLSKQFIKPKSKDDNTGLTVIKRKN